MPTTASRSQEPNAGAHPAMGVHNQREDSRSFSAVLPWASWRHLSGAWRRPSGPWKQPVHIEAGRRPRRWVPKTQATQQSKTCANPEGTGASPSAQPKIGDGRKVFKNIDEWVLDTGSGHDIITRSDVEHAAEYFTKGPRKRFNTAGGEVTAEMMCVWHRCLLWEKSLNHI